MALFNLRSVLLRRISVAVLVGLFLVLAALWPRSHYLPAQQLPFSAQRLADSPIITVAKSPRLTALAEAQGYININGPTMIRVPDWVEQPLGKYYLYFSHHKGEFIRMAYADLLEGPWTVYEPGVLSLQQSGFPVNKVPSLSMWAGLAELWDNFSIFIVRDTMLAIYQALVTDQERRKDRGLVPSHSKTPHIASPDIVVDNRNQRILMFFHGRRDSLSQITGIASSKNGVNFTVTDKTLRAVYTRYFVHGDQHYLLSSLGILFRSDNILGPYTPRDKSLFEVNFRHAAVLLEGDHLTVAWSKVGEAPERILLSQVDLSASNWNRWRATEAVELLVPELPWEGASLAPMPSLRGALVSVTNELRDPYLFVDSHNKKYLLYVGAGEQAIGIASLE